MGQTGNLRALTWICEFHLKGYFYKNVINGPGGGTPIYGLYRYVPRNRVWFLRFSVLK